MYKYNKDTRRKGEDCGAMSICANQERQWSLALRVYYYEEVAFRWGLASQKYFEGDGTFDLSISENQGLMQSSMMCSQYQTTAEGEILRQLRTETYHL